VRAGATERRFLADESPGGLAEGFCPAPLEDYITPVACDVHKWDTPHAIHKALVCVSITVLSLFELELLLLFVALGPKRFRENLLYVSDVALVTVALTLEILLYSFMRWHNLAEEINGIVILGRLWRLIRIGHSIYASNYGAAQSSQAYVQRLEAQVDQLAALARSDAQVAAQAEPEVDGQDEPDGPDPRSTQRGEGGV